MTQFILRRAGLALLVLLTISSLSFVLLKASGDLAISLAGEGGGANYVAFLRKTYGWDRPLYVQYFDWFWRLVQGDLGSSFYYNTPVFDLIAERMPVTLGLGAFAIVMALGVAIPLGVIAGLRPGSWIDRLVLLVAITGQSTPIFWLSFVLILTLGLNLAWLPISGGGSVSHYVMPAMALAFYALPAIIRIVRAGMSEAMASDYVRTARAKGLGNGAVIWRHALRNTLVPVVAIASVQFGFLLGGSVVVESIFALHGIGHLTYEAIGQNDYPVVQAAVMVVSACYVVLTLVADLMNTAIDPRIRHD